MWGKGTHGNAMPKEELEDGEGNDSGNEIGPLNVDDFEEVEEDTLLLLVVRHILVAPKQE